MTQTTNIVRIATRKSALALWQAEFVKAQLEHYHPGILVELVPMSTQGDIILDTPLAKIGGAIVGTSSLRRQCQIRASRPDLKIHDLRGNVNTRLAKLDSGQYDAIILAAAGLIRLEMKDRIRAYIEPEVSLPANGQGAVGIECRTDDEAIKVLLAPLEHSETRIRVNAERAMNRHLEGGCQVPIGAYALVNGDQTEY